MGEIPPDPTPEPWIPRIPASAGALLRDERGRVLILRPSYKPRWTIPGGQVEAGGETPWEACRRETLEETGIVLERARLACVDFLSPKPGRAGGMRFLFDGGVLAAEQIAGIRLQGPVRRRVLAALDHEQTVYLEDGRPVTAVPATPPRSGSSA
ncbi:MAG: NUDIX hydrolase [Solirubrobacteraceae bacterium]|nr:NUDIX hydrolase [Solirubrobacteraceae bacterium]